MQTYTMIIRFYFVYLLYFGIYPMIVHSYGDFEFLNDDNNMDAIDKARREKSSEDFIKLHRVKRSGPLDSTLSSHSPVSFTSMPPPISSSPPPSSSSPLPPLPPLPTPPPPSSSLPRTVSTPYTAMTTQSTMSPRYIIINYTTEAFTVQTTQFISQTRAPITNSTSMTTRTSTVTTTSSSYNPDTCGIPGYVKLFNNTCIIKSEAQIIAAGILNNSSNNATYTANALSLYISSITNVTLSSNQANTVSVNEIDTLVSNLTGVNLIVNSNTSFITVQQPDKYDNIIVLGALFIRGIGGEMVYTTNRDNVTQSFLSAAAIVSTESLNGVTSVNMLIIDKPTGYENVDNVTNKTLVSSVIVANLQRNSSTIDSVQILLYFKPLREYIQTGSGTYLCSFYDTNTSSWSEYGCTDAVYNTRFDRYECSCNHTTSFALIWLPESLLTGTDTKQFDAQDIASLVFQFVSIICFLAIMIHAIGIRFIDRSINVRALNLLPLISTASTTILFIFYIALGMTVYTQTSSADQTQCFLSSSILMFITYFFLIFMFCVKTSSAYFYYLRFVRLFPHPSHKRLLIMLIISFLISSLCVGVAVGVNVNSSYNITHLYPYELCWFTHDVIYYFMTIPIGIFLLLNMITIILVSRSIITHARNAATSKQIKERLKRCVIILLSSCVTQGIGWVFGPFISLVGTTVGDALGWIFVILNGLEGLWSILLYVLIRSQRIDEQKHVSAAIEFSKSNEIPLSKTKRLNQKNDHKRSNVQVTKKNIGTQRPPSFIDLRKRSMMNFSTDDDKVP